MATYLVLGGTGFIGRNLVAKLVKDGAKKVRVADKVLPDLAGLSAAEKTLFKETDSVEYMQANLTNPTAIAKAFNEDGGAWDYVINLACETKYSQDEAVYKDAVVELAKKCLDEAKKHSTIKRWIEVSTAQVYDSGKKASDESAKTKPWTKLAKAKLQAEEAVKASGVPHCILRLAVAYGPGDISGVTPRIVCAATYTVTKETMKFLWDKDLKMNTVHVADAVKAIIHAATNDKCANEVFNVVDHNETDQGKINVFLEKIFSISTGFMGLLKSKAATSVAMKTVADTANDQHMEPWSELCKQKGVTNTPLTPYLDEELLYNNSLSISGAKLEGTGWACDHPKMSEEALREVIKYFEENDAFPKGVC